MGYNKDQFNDILKAQANDAEDKDSGTAIFAGEFANTVGDGERSPADRARFIMNKVLDAGVTAALPLYQLVNRLDRQSAIVTGLEEAEQGHLASEWFLGESNLGLKGCHARVSSSDKPVHVPVTKQLLKQMEPGCGVLIDTKQGLIVGVEKRPLKTGQACIVQQVLGDNELLVTHKSEDLVAYLVGTLTGKVKAGDKVLMDEDRRVVSAIINTEPKGDDILTPVETLKGMNIAEYGHINPVAEEILFNAKAFVEHREFCEALRIPKQSSYLFSGPTGTGKSVTLRLIARELMEHVKNVTGQEVSRLATADATDFWSPYFGESEQKIKLWFQKLAAIGKQEHYDKKGNCVTIPMLVAIEEGESLFRSRGSHDASSHLFDRPLSLMLQMASSVGSEINAPVIFVMTSNRASLIDAAALRRFGMNQAFFDCLTEAQAKTVLQKKIDRKLPCESGTAGDNVNKILGYLFGEKPDQTLAVAKFGREERQIERRNLVTPAIIDEAVNAARKVALRKSVERNKQVGIEADIVSSSLHKHFTKMALNLKPHNLDEYLPSWFAGKAEKCSGVMPV